VLGFRHSPFVTSNHRKEYTVDSTILGLPINRFVTFIQPAINLFAGGISAWLVAKVQLLGILGLGHDEIQTQIAAGATMLLVTGVLELGRSQWIKGHHIELENGGIQIRATDPDQIPPDVDETISPPEGANG
jgi:hypothetical protein